MFKNFFLIILNAVYLSVIPTKLGRNMLNKMICIFANDYLEFAIYFVLGKVISWWMLVNVGPTEINTSRMWGPNTASLHLRGNKDFMPRSSSTRAYQQLFHLKAVYFVEMK